jgi:hypothetical protein
MRPFRNLVMDFVTRFTDPSAVAYGAVVHLCDGTN